jgi:uncharacterized protein YkwD
MNRRALPFLFTLICLSAATSRLFAADPAASGEANKAYQQALSKLNTGDRTAAIEGFKRAAQLAPGWGAPNARLGVIYQLQGKEEEAREQYRFAQAASLRGNSRIADNQRAEIIANEAYLVYLVNEARLREGQSALVPDPTVSVVARAHSEEMRDKQYFDHASPTPGLANCQDRFKAVFGYKPRCIGENVARRWGTAYCLKPEKILKSHTDLMASTGHRHNIMYPTFEWLGVGIAANANGDYWITQVFVESGR